MTEQRLIDLETKISLQEVEIDALQETVYEQQKSITALEKAVDRLMKRLDAAIDGGPEIGPANEKPPHY